MKRSRSTVLSLILLVSSSSALAQAPGAGAPAAPEQAPVAAVAPVDATAPEAVPAQPVAAVPAHVVQGPVLAAAPAPLSAAPAAQPASRIDSADYRRNRGFAVAGKVLTVVAAALFIPYAVAVSNADSVDDIAGLAVAWYLTGAAGRLTWAGSDLRMTNMMQRSGSSIRRGPAIASMVFAAGSLVPYVNLVATPGTWIAGSIASSNIRQARDEIGIAQMSLTPPTSHGIRGLSMGVTLRF